MTSIIKNLNYAVRNIQTIPTESHNQEMICQQNKYEGKIKTLTNNHDTEMLDVKDNLTKVKKIANRRKMLINIAKKKQIQIKKDTTKSAKTRMWIVISKILRNARTTLKTQEKALKIEKLRQDKRELHLAIQEYDTNQQNESLNLRQHSIGLLQQKVTEDATQNRLNAEIQECKIQMYQKKNEQLEKEAEGLQTTQNILQHNKDAMKFEAAGMTHRLAEAQAILSHNNISENQIQFSNIKYEVKTELQQDLNSLAFNDKDLVKKED